MFLLAGDAGLTLFGTFVSWAQIILIGAVLFVLLVLIVLSVIFRPHKKEVEDYDKREEFGDFHGLLTKEDFEVRADDHMLEVYRMQWIQAAPGDEKDNYLLLYLAMKQLNKEQDEAEDEWTQEQCEARMDEIIQELSEKTGLKLLVGEMEESEFETYFNEEDDEEETAEEAEDESIDEADDAESEENENTEEA